MHRDNLIDQPATPAMRDPRKIRRRKAMFALLFGFALVAAIVACVQWMVWGRYDEETDNAYVNGNIVQIASQTPGVVQDVAAANTECVKAGQVLIRLDPTDAQIALERAKGQLIQSVRQARHAALTNAMYEDAVRARTAELEVAEQALKARSGAPAEVVSGEEYARARTSLELARSNLASARNQLAAGRALTGSANVDDSPAVVDAMQQFRLAYVSLARTTIAAPVDGCVTQRSVQVGQPVGAGVQLMAIVPLTQLWVEANLKEGQIRNVRVGQAVKITSDLYGSNVVFHGRVEGLSPGTGSAFSMLPPQNAAGNWIKVVQRVPVLVSLDAAETAAHPLPIGVSMTVSIDTHQRDGKVVGSAGPRRMGSTPPVSDDAMRQADALVKTIIEDAETGHPRVSGSRGS
jgi:membrane fusion protein (multidrug efflux system)